MKKDKLTYNSNAKIRNFTIDDIGKLSINDIKKLKDMFSPKPRQSTKKKKYITDDDLDKQNIKSNEIRTGTEHMKGFAENLKPSQTNPFFRGYVPNPNNLLMLENSGDNSRFVNKSNLNIDDVTNVIKTNMNPLLENMRNEAKTQLLTEFKPYLENFDNTTKFITNDYQKFRDNTDKELRELYSFNQSPNIFDDDAGNFGGAKGSEHFISLDDKDEQKENLLMGEDFYDEEEPQQQLLPQSEPESESETEQEPEQEPEPPAIDFEEIKKTDKFEHYMNATIKLDEAKQLYKDLRGNDQNIINAQGKGSINKVRGGISGLLKANYDYHEKDVTKDAKTKQWKFR